VVLAAAAALSLTAAGEAGQRVTAPSSGQSVTGQTQSGSAPRLETADAGQTRDVLIGLLNRHPPVLARVLKLDPSLMSNAAYLEPYPAIAAFLAEHPEIQRNPEYFFEGIHVGSGYSADPRTQQRRDFYDALGAAAAIGMSLVVLGILVWLIRMVAAHRRWNRLSKSQFEVHTKLLDRFTTHEELLAYIQTPAGRKFLESAPIPLQGQPAPIGAPFSRIIWSVQAGVVLTVAGVGLLFVSRRFVDEPAHFFFVLGMVTLALGVGFIVSGGAAYLLSRRLGLLDPVPSSHA
jgi:hypothetical protein